MYCTVIWVVVLVFPHIISTSVQLYVIPGTSSRSWNCHCRNQEDNRAHFSNIYIVAKPIFSRTQRAQRFILTLGRLRWRIRVARRYCWGAFASCQPPQSAMHNRGLWGAPLSTLYGILIMLTLRKRRSRPPPMAAHRSKQVSAERLSCK